MVVDCISLPSDLHRTSVSGHAVVVFDVLRATTTITAAFAADVEVIHVFGDLASAREAADASPNGRLLCGEHRCLPPDGFDLGNSPVAFDPAQHAGRTMFLATTNGTRAFMAAREAAWLGAGAIVNAAAVARALIATGLPVMLLCAGTDGSRADEDILGAGAVAAELLKRRPHSTLSDAAREAVSLFSQNEINLLATMRETQGGRNIRSVGLDEDITFASKLNSIDIVGVVARSDERSLMLTRFAPV